jgi:hypothetical protein
MTFYPHYENDYMSQTWHGTKMVKDISDDLLSPTLRYNGHIYWVNEVVQRVSGNYFIPKRWVMRGRTNPEPWCLGYETKMSKVRALT